MHARSVLTELLKRLNSLGCTSNQQHTITSDQNSNSISTSGLMILGESEREQAQSVFLTLHFLFPHELLPALDILDRKLLKRLITHSSTDNAGEVYFVQSASAVTDPLNRRFIDRDSRFGNATRTYYEVRLDAWNCTCAAFAQSQMKILVDNTNRSTDAYHVPSTIRSQGSDMLLFGGISTKANAVTPICKHILAATFNKSAPALFAEGCEESLVSAEEMAGWCAGWGEV